jgi:AcrR family transcriptional regulator
VAGVVSSGTRWTLPAFVNGRRAFFHPMIVGDLERNEIRMKTHSKNGHRPGESGSVANLESCFGNGTMHGRTGRETKAKTSTILRVAAQIFAEHGYQAASMDAIAECAGIAKGTVYLYFRSKQELFFGVCDAYIATIEGIRTQVNGCTAPTAASQIRQSIHTLLTLRHDTPDLFPLILEFWSVSASPHRHARVAASLRLAYSKLRRSIADQIRKGQREGEFDCRADASQLAAMLLGALDGTCLQGSFDPGLDPVSIGDQFVSILLRSLAAPERVEGRFHPEDGVE